MNIDKAIVILKMDLLVPGSVDKLDFQDAEQLGIEALKLLGLTRLIGAHLDPYLLPGETKD